MKISNLLNKRNKVLLNHPNSKISLNNTYHLLNIKINNNSIMCSLINSWFHNMANNNLNFQILNNRKKKYTYLTRLTNKDNIRHL